MRLIERLTRCARTAWSVVRTIGSIGRTFAGSARSTVRTAARVAVPVCAIACSRAEPPTAVTGSHAGAELVVAPTDASVGPSIDASVRPPPKPGRALGRFLVTMYYVASEDEVDGPHRHGRAANDNESVTGGSDVTLAGTVPMDASARAPSRDLVPAYDRHCKPIVQVSRAFRAQMALQGTGRLRDGRVLNVAGRCKCEPCFHVLPSHREWGMAGMGIPLEPFRTVAVDPSKIRLGTLLYIPALDGLRMPGRAPVGGFVHDGCVIAADTGGNIDGNQLDLFVARKAYFNGLARRGGSHKWMRSLEVFDGTRRCQRKGGKVSQSQAGAG